MIYSNNHITSIEEMYERTQNVFTERWELKSSFAVASIYCIRAFFVPKISRFKKSFRDSLRVDKRIESFKKYKQGLRRANREKAKHLISSNLEREGDNLTATADHGVVAHMLKSIAEKNCFYFTCYIRGLIKGLVMGISPLAPS